MSAAAPEEAAATATTVTPRRMNMGVVGGLVCGLHPGLGRRAFASFGYHGRPGRTIFELPSWGWVLCTAFTRNGVLYRAFFVTGTEDLALTLGLERRKRPSYERPDAHGCRVTLHPRSDYAIHTGSRRPYFLLAYTVQGTLLLPPRLVIAFRPLPSNHTLLTVCALRPFPCKRLHEPAETKKLKTFC